MESKTIGKMLNEMESQIESASRIKSKIEKFKFILDNAPDEKKRELLKAFLKESGYESETEV